MKNRNMLAIAKARKIPTVAPNKGKNALNALETAFTYVSMN